LPREKSGEKKKLKIRQQFVPLKKAAQPRGSRAANTGWEATASRLHEKPPSLEKKEDLRNSKKPHLSGWGTILPH